MSVTAALQDACPMALWRSDLDDVDGCEVAAQAVEAPVGERQLQQAHQAVDGVVDGHHAPKVGEAEERPEDGVVGGVQEEAARAPHNQCHDLQRQPWDA